MREVQAMIKDRTKTFALSKELRWRFWFHRLGEQEQAGKFLIFIFIFYMIKFKTSFNIDSGAEGKRTGW